MTPAMWELLRYVNGRSGEADVFFAAWLHTARILERRGFMTVAAHPDGYGYYRVRLTVAGEEAMAGRREN